MALQPGQAAFVAGASSNPTSMVELSLSCNKLADMDTFSKSDPFAVLYLKDSRSGHWVYVDRTETIDNTLNPQWAKKFVLEFQFEKRQLMKIAEVNCHFKVLSFSAEEVGERERSA